MRLPSFYLPVILLASLWPAVCQAQSQPDGAEKNAAAAVTPEPTRLPGETRLEGVIAATGQGQFTLNVSTLTSPDGRVIIVSPPRTKLVILGAGTGIHTRGNAEEIAFSDLLEGTSVVACGDNPGVGRPLVARDVSVWTSQEDGVYRFRSIATRVLDPGDMARNLQSVHAPHIIRPGERPKLALQQGHTATINMTVFSPDGRLVASGSRDHTARIWDAATGRINAVLQHGDWVNSVAFSPDGTLLATGGGDGIARIWEPHTGQLLRELPIHAWIFSVAFSPDGQLLAVGDNECTSRLWDVRSGECLHVLAGHTADITTVAFSPDGTLVATGSKDTSIRLWDPRSGECRATLKGHKGVVASVRFFPDGRHLASGSSDNTIRFWSIDDQSALATLPVGFGVTSMAMSRDGRSLAVVGPGGTSMKVWDTGNGQLRWTGKDDGGVGALTFSPDGNTVVSGNGSVAQVWDVATGALRYQPLPHGTWVRSVSYSPDGRTLLTACDDGSARIWDSVTGSLQRVLAGYGGGGTGYAYSPDGDILATTSVGNSIMLWDARTRQPVGSLHSDSGVGSALAFARDGRTLATGSGGVFSSGPGSVLLWDVASRSARVRLAGSPEAVSSMAFSPDGMTLAVGSMGHRWGAAEHLSGELALYDTRNGQVRTTLVSPAEKVHVRSVAFSPDGTRLAAAIGDQTNDALVLGRFKVWDLATGQVKLTLTGDLSQHHGVAFSPDGALLATAGNQVQLWDSRTGQQLAVLPGGIPGLDKLAFSKDGRYLAGYSQWATIPFGLWDVAARALVPKISPLILSLLPPDLAGPVRQEGATLALINPPDNRVTARLVPVPEVQQTAAVARALPAGATNPGAGEWFITTPEGYFDCSANAMRYIRWNVGGRLYPAERFLKHFRRPDLVRKALAGEIITAPAISGDDIPPTSRLLGVERPQSGQTAPMTVTVEARGHRALKEVLVQVNGRPLAPSQAASVTLTDAPPATGPDAADYPFGKRYTFQVPLPVGAEDVRIRAIAYDQADLASPPAEIGFSRLGIRAVSGDLYVLSVGVGRYRNGLDRYARPGEISNLRFPPVDARALAERLQKEGRPLYDHVYCHTLVDGEVTLGRLREELAWLQKGVRPGQVDTVVLFLSGHGTSDDEGRSYVFPMSDFEFNNIKATSLSGQELQDALGGKLQARAVFLFVDTCHSGALTGRSDDLRFELNSSGVYLMASSAASQVSYEDPGWGHGAFTLALLNALSNPFVAHEGLFYYNRLAYAIPGEVAKLMKAAGYQEEAQQPCIPLEGCLLRVPVAHLL